MTEKITGIWLWGCILKLKIISFWSAQLYSPKLLLSLWKSNPSLNFPKRRKSFACSCTQIITALSYYRARLFQFGDSFSLQTELEKLLSRLFIQANDDLSSQENSCHKWKDSCVDVNIRLWFYFTGMCSFCFHNYSSLLV